MIDFEEVHILVPHNLEVRWGLGRPRNGSIKKIIFCVFYHPPKARKKKALIDHLILTLHSLLSTHYDAEIVIGGDRNELDLFQVFNSIPNLKLLPSAPTHKNKVLDVFATTMWKLYDPPIIVDPVDVDIMGQGKPSDHRCSILYPISNTPSHRTAEYIIRNVRPLPASRLLDFRSALGDTDFEPVFSAGDTNLADERLLNILHSTMNQHLPIKTLKLRTSDKPFVTPELKVLDRLRKREYTKHGKSEKFLYLKDKFDTLYKKAAKDYLSKNVDHLLKSKPGRAHRTLKLLGARPGDDTDSSTFSIPEIRDKELTDDKAANYIGDYFAKILQEHAPLDLAKLPLRVRDAIESFNKAEIPLITPELVTEVFATVVRSKGAVEGDIPTRLYLDNIDILAPSIAHLFGRVAETGVWPARWNVKHTSP